MSIDSFFPPSTTFLLLTCQKAYINFPACPGCAQTQAGREQGWQNFASAINGCVLRHDRQRRDSRGGAHMLFNLDENVKFETFSAHGLLMSCRENLRAQERSI